MEATRAFRHAARGTTVICDRYPTLHTGAVDGPRLEVNNSTGLLAGLYNSLARLERWYYRRIPRPDLVIRLDVPIDVAQQRNRDRKKPDKESECYLAQRHQQFLANADSDPNTHVVETGRPLQEVLTEIQSIVWQSL
jgi:thymidylate kinase